MLDLPLMICSRPFQNVGVDLFSPCLSLILAPLCVASRAPIAGLCLAPHAAMKCTDSPFTWIGVLVAARQSTPRQFHSDLFEVCLAYRAPLSPQC
jgi:hypothetical protein